MPDDPEKTLQELRQRICTEGLPKLSAEALRLCKREERRGPRVTQPTTSKPLLSLSQKPSDCSKRKLIPHGLGSGDSQFSWRHHDVAPKCAVLGQGEDHSSSPAGPFSSALGPLLSASSMVLTNSSSSDALNRRTASVRPSTLTVRSTPPLFLTA
jgi:hypothetical protein